MTLREMLLGGPGLDGYAYCADTYCVSCGQDIITSLVKPDVEVDEGDARDSEQYPQPIFFGEHSHRAVHCGDCGDYLYGEEGEV